MAEDPDGIVQALLAEDPFLLQDPQLGGYGDPNPKTTPPCSSVPRCGGSDR